MSRVPEPASAALRRLHEEATKEAVSIGDLNARARADETTRDALPALADLVEAVEATHSHIDYEPECGECVALAALRERLEARP